MTTESPTLQSLGLYVLRCAVRRDTASGHEQGDGDRLSISAFFQGALSIFIKINIRIHLFCTFLTNSVTEFYIRMFSNI